MTAPIQTTKSREAYKAQQQAFLHRPFSSSSPRRSRPQSAGSAGWSGSRDRSGGGSKSGVKENGFPPSCPPPVYHRSPSGSFSGGGGRARGASFDLAPPSFGRGSDTATAGATGATTTNANGGGARPGKPRTRVRPNSASARVYGRPGAGQGVGGGGGREQPPGSGAASGPRRVHAPRHTYGYGGSTPTGDGGKVTPGNSRDQASVVECFATLEGMECSPVVLDGVARR